MTTAEDRLRAIMVADRCKRDACKVRQESLPRAAEDVQAKTPLARWNTSLKHRPTVEAALSVVAINGAHAARERWGQQIYKAVRDERLRNRETA